MIFVDTGYLIGLADPIDALHTRSVAWSTAVRGPYVTTAAVVVEFLNHFSGPSARARALVLYDRIRARQDWSILALDDAQLASGVDLYRRRPDKAWSLTDCLSFTSMTDRGIARALAYDHHFEQAGFEALLRRDPP